MEKAFFKNKIIKGIVEEVNGYEATVNFPQYGNHKRYGIFLKNSGSSSNQIDFAPSIGDRVLIIFDNDGDAHVLQTFFDINSDRNLQNNEKGMVYRDGKKNYYEINSNTLSSLNKYILNAENIELSDASDWAVLYSQLLIILNQILTQYNAHTHNGAVAVPTATLTYVPTAIQSTKIKIG